MLYLKITGMIFTVIGIVIFYLWSNYSPRKIIWYISKNNENGSIYVVKNKKVILNKNSESLLPLASTVKIIIVIEFAKQAASGKVTTTELVKLSELDKYFIKNTDGGTNTD